MKIVVAQPHFVTDYGVSYFEKINPKGEINHEEISK